MEKVVMDIKETAVYLDMSESYLRKLVRAKLIPHFTYGNRIKFYKDSINEWIKQQEEKSGKNIIYGYCLK